MIPKIVTIENVNTLYAQSDHKNQTYSANMKKDFVDFINKNPACKCKLVENDDAYGKKKVFEIAGALPINLPNGTKPSIGFKFILPFNYPEEPPYVYLDG